MGGAPEEPRTLLVHFYRAVVHHADVWRQRMDSTTNWAAATTAGMITFTFGTPDAPHFVLLLTLFFDGVFLLIESRRYQAYDRWRRQFHNLNRYLIAPWLVPGEEPEAGAAEDAIREGMRRIRRDLGRTVPHLGLFAAAGYRIRRNYAYLFTIVLMAWVLKLYTHPVPASGMVDALERAGIAGIPAEGVLGGVLAASLVGTLLAFLAPSEQMMDWQDIGAPWRRFRRGEAPGGGAPRAPSDSGGG